MLAPTYTAHHSPCNRNLCSSVCVSSDVSLSRHVVRRASNHAAAAAAGSSDPGIIAALRWYGDHAKAAYVLYTAHIIYDQFCDDGLQPADIESKDLHSSFKGGSLEALADWQGLQGYNIIANIMGYPGRHGVFTVPTPINEGLVGLAGLEDASFIGYIAEGTGQDGVPELVIAFRGTNTWADWETNLLGAVATDRLYGSGRVHRGFHNLIHGTPDDATDDTNPVKTINAVLARYKDTAKQPRIITTGYCQGASEPDYTARKLQTYTFAAPRIGDRILSKYFSGDTLNYKAVQVKNQSDVVPYVPPASLRELLGTLRKLIGMRARRQLVAGELTTAVADDTGLEGDPIDMDRWEAYMELLSELKSTDPDEQVKELQQNIHQARQQYDMAGDVSTADRENLARKILYGGQLLLTVATKWSDNPAPANGLFIMDVRNTGKWGHNHSLEVYLDNLESCKSS